MNPLDELNDLRAELARTRAELHRAQTLLEALFEQHPDGICVFGADGSVRANQVGAQITGSQASPSQDADWKAGYQFFEADRATPMPFERLPAARAMMAGETVTDELMYLVGGAMAHGVMVESSARPLPGGGAVALFRDVTERLRLEGELSRRNDALAARDVENRELVSRLRAALEDLSTPVIEVAADVLVLPVVGAMDAQRATEMSSRLLDHVVRARARQVIIDVTGVDSIDTATADRLVQLARGVKMLGAECVLSGIQPRVAATMVDLGVSLGGVPTERNLRRALEWCGVLAPRAAPARA